MSSKTSSNTSNKRPPPSSASSASELELSQSESSGPPNDDSVFKERTTSKTQDKPKNPKKQAKIDDFVKAPVPTPDLTDTVDADNEKIIPGIEKRLDGISKQLANLLSKDDTSFLREIIIDTMTGLKDQLLSSVNNRIEVLEGEVHDQANQIDKLKKELKVKDSVIEELNETNSSLKQSIKEEEKFAGRQTNDLEQYSRRNNIRIYGINDDAYKQSSETVTAKVISTINEKTSLTLKKEDIDISHRLGKYTEGKHRPIIVKFVRRQSKVDLFKKSKSLKEKEIFVNEDLTKMNQEVLASLRLKKKDDVIKAYSFEGRIYAQFRGEENSVQVKYDEYRHWLEMPWPKK